MGLWAGIKHALNSTVGTRYFKPLNEMVTRHLEADEQVYKNIPISYYLPGDLDWLANKNFAKTNKIDFYTSGSITLRAVNSHGGEEDASISHLYYKLEHTDGTYEEETLIGINPTYNSGRYYVTLEKTFQIRLGDVLYTKFYSNVDRTDSSGTASQGQPIEFTIRAKETQWSMVDVTTL